MLTKYQVFISSTYNEFRDQRKTLIDEILRLDHIPSGMEGFAAGDEWDWAVIRRAIDQCDIYVVVVGALFGSVYQPTIADKPSAEPESYTQREFRYASAQGKPILAFLLQETDVTEVRSALPNEDKERAHDARLKAFRDEVLKSRDGKRRLASFFSKTEGLHRLPSLFSAAFNRLINNPSFNAAGWVRLQPEVGTNPFIRRVMEKLSSFDTLSKRCTDFPDVKDVLARHFWYHFSPELIKHGIWHLFFESGSTVAFVAEHFRDHLHSPAWEQHKSKLRVHTNNVLTYLVYTLNEHLRVELVPHGPPGDNDKYGATFGQLLNHPEDPHPTKKNKPLSETDSKAVELVEIIARSVVPPSEQALILATASGLEDAADKQFPGPHVGTYRNKLLKRALLRTSHPIVLFFDSSKIAPGGSKGRFIPGKCHSVCDPEFPWSQIVSDSPVCLCVGATEKVDLEASIKSLTATGMWDAESPREYEHGWAALIKNRSFSRAFRQNSNGKKRTGQTRRKVPRR